MLDAAQCRTVEPGLTPIAALFAGIHLPQDEVGNCRQFAQLFAKRHSGSAHVFASTPTVQSLEPGKTPQAHQGLLANGGVDLAECGSGPCRRAAN